MADVYLVLPRVNISFSGKRLFAGKSDELTIETETDLKAIEQLIAQGKVIDITGLDGDADSNDDVEPEVDPELDDESESDEIDLDALNLEQLKALADQEEIEYGTTIGEDTLRQRIFDHFEAEQGE